MKYLAVIVALSSTVGCVDPGADYEAFIDRQARPEPGIDAGGGGGAGDGGEAPEAGVCLPSLVAGDYVLALSVNIAPETPIVANVTLETSDAPAELELSSIQPLAASDRTTPVGSSFSAGPFPVTGGLATASVPDLRVDGAANPITGSNIVAAVTLAFDLCPNGDYLCGAVSGSVTAPLELDLAGSTFTMTRADEVDVEALPIDCEGTLADPL